MNREEVLAAVRATPSEKLYVWDGVDEDDRPATAEELQAMRLRPDRSFMLDEWV